MQNACCDCLLQMQVANACSKANATCKCLQQTKYNLQMLAAKQMQPAKCLLQMQVANACSKVNATLRVLGDALAFDPDALAIDLDASAFDPDG
ncbi:hypothetical protein Tco_0370126 [Tanacetum coccineum]